MVPASFANFFLAATGAGAALIGLLFVAVSIRPERLVRTQAHPLVRAATASTFTALANGFFISFTALLPNMNIGGPTLVMGASGAINALWTGIELARHLPRSRTQRGNTRALLGRGFLLVTASLVIYGYEIYYAVEALHSPSDAGPVFVIGILVVFTFGLGLVRAWTLLGTQRVGLLAWLSPLASLEDLEGE
jgi:hypothetical protein